jgi:hypothetical protein
MRDFFLPLPQSPELLQGDFIHSFTTFFRRQPSKSSLTVIKRRVMSSLRNEAGENVFLAETV